MGERNSISFVRTPRPHGSHLIICIKKRKHRHEHWLMLSVGTRLDSPPPGSVGPSSLPSLPPCLLVSSATATGKQYGYIISTHCGRWYHAASGKGHQGNGKTLRTENLEHFSGHRTQSPAHAFLLLLDSLVFYGLGWELTRISQTHDDCWNEWWNMTMMFWKFTFPFLF